jgi:hypothetical protein
VRRVRRTLAAVTAVIASARRGSISAVGSRLSRLAPRRGLAHRFGLIVLGGSLVLVAGTVGVAGAGSSVTYNGCENLATGIIRLLPSKLPAPWNTTCNTSTTNPLL